jgi:hypothetical protein
MRKRKLNQEGKNYIVNRFVICNFHGDEIKGDERDMRVAHASETEYKI